MKNQITLNFDKTLSKLAGNKLGYRIYLEQVKDKICYDNTITIVFPDFVEDIAISFVQGFISEIIQKTGKDGFADHFEIKGTDKVVSKFYESVLF